MHPFGPDPDAIDWGSPPDLVECDDCGNEHPIDEPCRCVGRSEVDDR